MMSMLAQALIAVVALLHLFFLVLEMFLWTKPLGLKVFRNTPEKAEISRVLAANQGAALARGRHLLLLNNDAIVQQGALVQQASDLFEHDWRFARGLPARIAILTGDNVN